MGINRNPDRARRATIGALAAVALALAASGARAQGASERLNDPRWQPWLGCWEPASEAPIPGGEAVCFIPRGAGIAIATVSGRRIVAERTVVADGRRRPADPPGCTGWETAQWSADAHRVFVRAGLECAGVERQSSEIIAMLPGGRWLDVQAAIAGDDRSTYVQRYRPAPPEIGAALRLDAPDSELSLSAARDAASAALSVSDVVEATRLADAEAVEALVAERGAGFILDARTLGELADAGVPGRVTDVMVALSYPETFTLNRETYRGFRLAEPEDRYTRTQSGRSAGDYPLWIDAWGYDRWGYDRWGYDPYLRYGRLNRHRHGYGYGYGYGYGGYGYGYGYGGSGPVVIIRDGQPVDAGGKLVKGRGYTRRNSDADRTGSRGGEVRPRSGTSTETRSSGGSVRSSGGKSGGGSKESGSSGSGGGRKAKPRN